MIFPTASFAISKYDCSGYVGLKPHPDFDFINGEKVKYESFDLDENPFTQYCILAYYPPLSAFVLVNYTDESFNELLTEEQHNTRMDLLAEIGIELLTKI